MSTFRGELREIPGLRVDFFENPEEGCLFFLSHCHTDHMVGIRELASLPGAQLVVSHLTKSILVNLYPELEPVTRPIDTKQEYLYTLADGQQVLCTALPAGHCPGSVMFYFQTEQLNVLYTGDFRWRVPSISATTTTTTTTHKTGSKTVEMLKKNLDAIYLDSTFLLPEFSHFPAQKDSIEAVVGLVREWLADGVGKNRVFLEIPARFGSERLLVDLHQRLGLEMHLSDADQGCLLPFIPEMKQFIVPVLNDAVMVVVGMRNTVLNPRFQWRTIRPSAMFWARWKPGDAIYKKDSARELFRVCYSSHSSREEIRWLLEELQPKAVHLNVCPDGKADRRWEELKKIKWNKVKMEKEDIVAEEKEEEVKRVSLVEAYSVSAEEKEQNRRYRERLAQIREELKDSSDSDSEEEKSAVIIPIRKKIKVN